MLLRRPASTDGYLLPPQLVAFELFLSSSTLTTNLGHQQQATINQQPASRRQQQRAQHGQQAVLD
jgi:hypothetical protein